MISFCRRRWRSPPANRSKSELTSRCNAFRGRVTSQGRQLGRKEVRQRVSPLQGDPRARRVLPSSSRSFFGLSRTGAPEKWHAAELMTHTGRATGRATLDAPEAVGTENASRVGGTVGGKNENRDSPFRVLKHSLQKPSVLLPSLSFLSFPSISFLASSFLYNVTFLSSVYALAPHLFLSC